VFVVNTVTLFFRPASFTIVPRLVPAEDLMAANSATSTAATLADLAGYPIAGIITVLLAPIIAIAFVLDSASFFASAALCLALPSDRPEAAAHESLRTDFLVGWQALRRDAALLEGAILTAAIWLPTGIMLPLLVTYAAQDLLDGPIGYPASYSALLLSLALGFLAGAVLVSYLCRRIRRGLVILAGYGLYVPQIMILVLSHNSLVAVGAVFFGGLGNALWLVAIQTIYMERTPRAVLGRVVAFRQTLVWGAMSLSSVAAAMIVTAVSVPLAFTASAILTSAILLVAWTRPAMRDPDGVPLPAD
jgi:predicted MFS family arabinose efflux permease